MINEYTIACLLDHDSQYALKNNFSYLDRENVPHVSLFQFKTTIPSFLSFLQLKLKELNVASSLNATFINNVEENIFLFIDDINFELRNASDHCAEVYANYCQHKETLSQIDTRFLDFRSRSLVEKYGIYWIKEQFVPHVTLAYNRKYLNTGKQYFPLRFKVLPPNIYQMNRDGKILSESLVEHRHFYLSRISHNAKNNY